MRVASRRLRAVLEMFEICFPKREFRDVLRDVKRIADALGMRRDPDVHIAAMERFADAAGEAARPGIALLIEHLRGEQQEGNRTLEAELERLESTDLHARLRALADHAEAMVEPPAPEPEEEDGDEGPGDDAEPATPEASGEPEPEPHAESDAESDPEPEAEGEAETEPESEVADEPAGDGDGDGDGQGEGQADDGAAPQPTTAEEPA
jgi:hypothetical protein